MRKNKAIKSLKELDYIVSSLRNRGKNLNNAQQQDGQVNVNNRSSSPSEDELVLYFTLDSYTKDVGEKITECVDLVKLNGYNPQIIIKADGLDFTYSDFEVFIDLEIENRDKNVGVLLSEGSNHYSVEQTLDAFGKCKAYAEYVKNKEASPFEKYLMIYRFVTSRVYTKETNGDAGMSRNLISILTNDEIVCVGYSKLLKYLCNQVGIKCETQLLDIYEKNDEGKFVGRHQNNIVYLKDEKYGIDGYYYADACWDSVKKNKEPYRNYLFSLLPLADVEKFKSRKMNFETTGAFFKDYDDVSLMLDGEKLQGCANLLEINHEYSSFLDDLGFEGLLNKTAKAGAELESLFRKNGIPANFYDEDNYVAIPKKFDYKFLLSLLMVDPAEKELVGELVRKMKKFVSNQGRMINDESEEFGLVHMPTDSFDVYNELNNFKEKNFTIEELGVIQGFYNNYQLLFSVKDKLRQAKESSVPISLENFYDALVQSFKLEGYDDKNIDFLTKEIIKQNYARGKLHFKNASNCFMLKNYSLQASEKA